MPSGADRERPATAPGAPPGAPPDEPPPFLGSWGAVYAVVLGWLGLLVVLFHLMTRWAA